MTCRTILTLCLAYLVLGLSVGGCAKPAEETGPPAPARKDARTPSALRATAGCAAQACHGGPITTAPSSASAATWWLDRDPHAAAGRTLAGERSAAIERRLAGHATPINAERDLRCLTCHADPTAVPTRSAAALGMTCETCHGPSRDWLGPHTNHAWTTDRRDKADAAGMTWLNSPGVRAAVCAGCHVGAPPDPAHGLPARAVTHDLIAAGHPRLNFELTSYQRALPPHWIERSRDEPNEPIRPAPFIVRLWLDGQLASTGAALELLQSGALGDGPWPEFADSNCYMCHHDLGEPSWRRSLEAARPRGSLGQSRPGPWHGSLVLGATLHALGVTDLEATTQPLTELLSRPAPDRTAVTTHATAVIKKLVIARQSVERADDASLGKALREGITRTLAAQPGTGLGSLDWDDVAQLAVAEDVLRRATMSTGEGAEADRQRSAELVRLLGFPAGAERSDSPRQFRRTAEVEQAVRRLLEEQVGVRRP